MTGVRTYKRKARQEYPKFAKKKAKTKKTIARAKKAMLQYVRRNLRQQREMYMKKTHRIADRIVSLHRAYVRPIKTGKLAKDTEFGAKRALAHVDGFLFLDHLKHKAFNESELALAQIRAYKERFGKLPPYMAAEASTEYSS